MEKINIKLQDLEQFKQGQKDFREKRIENKGISSGWYKTKITIKEWNEYYSKIPGYTFLDGDKKEVSMGFLAVIAPMNCLEITNIEELKKIDSHRKAIRHSPFVFDDN